MSRQLNLPHLVIILALLISGCDFNSSESEDSVGYIPPPPSNRYIQNSLEFHYGDTVFYYAVAAPEDYASRTDIPVIMYLHGNGGDENSDLWAITGYVDGVVKECGVEQPLIIFPGNQNRFYILDQNQGVAVALLEHVAQDYKLAGPEKNMIMGFSTGGSTAVRAAIVNPGSYTVSYSWGGGIWPKDDYLFGAVATNAAVLNDNKFKAVLINGDDDEPEAYDKLIGFFKDESLNYEKIILQNQGHDLGLYLQQSRDHLKTTICDLLKK